MNDALAKVLVAVTRALGAGLGAWTLWGGVSEYRSASRACANLAAVTRRAGSWAACVDGGGAVWNLAIGVGQALLVVSCGLLVAEAVRWSLERRAARLRTTS